MSASPAPEVYGDPVVYVCRCRSEHGVIHLCQLCRVTSPHRPADPWVEAERCRTCIVAERERLEAELRLNDRRLRTAVNAVDGVTGERIPPMFLTAEGWQR